MQNLISAHMLCPNKLLFLSAEFNKQLLCNAGVAH